MEILTHYKNQSKVELASLVKDDISFAVLYKILHFNCQDIITDHKNIIMCYSTFPFPVWIYCNDLSHENIICIANYIKTFFPLEKGYSITLTEELLDKLKEIDLYFNDVKIKLQLLSHRLDKINKITKKCDGKYLLANQEDTLYLSKMWKDMEFEMEGFDLSTQQCLEIVTNHIKNKTLYKWVNDNNDLVAITAKEALNSFGKISAVYTIPCFRRKGYAINLVYEVTKLLISENKIPILYTDGGYIASNECYRKIGYKQVNTLYTINKNG